MDTAETVERDWWPSWKHPGMDTAETLAVIVSWWKWDVWTNTPFIPMFAESYVPLPKLATFVCFLPFLATCGIHVRTTRVQILPILAIMWLKILPFLAIIWFASYIGDSLSKYCIFSNNLTQIFAIFGNNLIRFLYKGQLVQILPYLAIIWFASYIRGSLSKYCPMAQERLSSFAIVMFHISL